MLRTLSALLLVLLFLPKGCEQDMKDIDQAGIIPAPLAVKINEGQMYLPSSIAIYATDPEATKPIVAALKAILKPSNGFTITAGQDKNAHISLSIVSDRSLSAEGYFLEINPHKIDMRATDAKGLFYAVQSFRQLLPPQIESNTHLQFPIKLPCLTITDTPRFGWRGMHLDVSRHFRTVDEVKRYIDLMARHKMNTFHWHLIDDQGWRLEIKQYPKLTSIGAWRVDREEEKEWRIRQPQQPGDSTTYGGFYTQDEVRNVIDYAQKRYITVIPEIEMPAHVTSALAAYPELSCTGGPFTVPPGSIWPITDIYCAGKETTFEFLENVLMEVMALFPSPYIHIGGDEANKLEWKRCPHCQKRIEQEGLADEAELQSYFVQRIEKFLNANGKKLIGWDEIIEGGLSPNATIMSWRGEKGGIEAAKSGHDAVMSPVSHCYFDYYQGNPATEPLAIGGLTSLNNVYAYEPVPAELSKKEGRHILGAQGNLWAEYMATYDHVEYMAVPRMTALAEVVWSPVSHRNWNSFSHRLKTFLQRLSFAGHTYSTASYEVTINACFDPEKKKMKITMTTEHPGVDIYYTLNGENPGKSSNYYQNSIYVDRSGTIKAVGFQDSIMVGKPSEEPVYVHKALGKPTTYTFPYKERYAGNGEIHLVDGLEGSNYYNDQKWQGFQQDNLEVVIDLEDITSVSQISIRFLSRVYSWIFQPASVHISYSLDNKVFTPLKDFKNELSPEDPNEEIKAYVYNGEALNMRYIKVIGENIGVCPDWHKGAGDKVWIFADEIIVK